MKQGHYSGSMSDTVSCWVYPKCTMVIPVGTPIPNIDPNNQNTFPCKIGKIC